MLVTDRGMQRRAKSSRTFENNLAIHDDIQSIGVRIVENIVDQYLVG